MYSGTYARRVKVARLYSLSTGLSHAKDDLISIAAQPQAFTSFKRIRVKLR